MFAPVLSHGLQKTSARLSAQLITRSDDGYVAVTLPRDEPNWMTRGYFVRSIFVRSVLKRQPKLELIVARFHFAHELSRLESSDDPV